MRTSTSKERVSDLLGEGDFLNLGLLLLSHGPGSVAVVVVEVEVVEVLSTGWIRMERFSDRKSDRSAMWCGWCVVYRSVCGLIEFWKLMRSVNTDFVSLFD